MNIPYVGSGPYCYANAFAMMFGAAAPSTAVIEFSTASPFGMQLIGGRLPFFDPYGWDPERGFDDALAALGWSSDVARGGTAEEALSRLKSALARGPVWVGPVEMGYLTHQPGMKEPIEADHYVVVLEVDEERVLMHDPQGYPFALLPLTDFMAAWAAKTVAYGTPYTMRTRFVRQRNVTEVDIIKAAIPAAKQWLSMEHAPVMPAGSLGNSRAAEALAELVADNCDDALRGHLIHFAVRVGARRTSDAAACLARIGSVDAAVIVAEQARLIGSLQHPLVVGDDRRAAAALMNLAPTYDRLRAVL